MSHRNLAIGTVVILVSFVTLTVLLITSYTKLQAINPVAALTATVVAVIGISWFKKTRN
ncbi:MAG TPA: hypothetical protein VK253_05870 [Candidatus Binatia bacterium]|nr:hypothetical protein [Candidatus Binatia bacterium]